MTATQAPQNAASSTNNLIQSVDDIRDELCRIGYDGPEVVFAENGRIARLTVEWQDGEKSFMDGDHANRYGKCLNFLMNELDGRKAIAYEFSNHIGEKQEKAVQYLDAQGPAQSMHVVAKAVGPHGSTDYGYRTVNRCKQRDLLRVVPIHEVAEPHGAGAVMLSDKGQTLADRLSKDSDAT